MHLDAVRVLRTGAGPAPARVPPAQQLRPFGQPRLGQPRLGQPRLGLAEADPKNYGRVSGGTRERAEELRYTWPFDD
ncbi:hypothetical protein [Streptomyces sp. NPDC060002]|uniref:hypothetical protein n=1 Tax=Streptomyces sp. NPDC060002 TaxID=3347033 RepID=UPI0036874C11